MQYALKLYSNKLNPTFEIVFNYPLIDRYQLHPNSIQPFGLRIKPELEQAGINLEYIADYKVPNTPPWRLITPTILKSMIIGSKQEIPPIIYLSIFYEISEEYKDYLHFYTDGSKKEAATSAALVTESNVFRCRLTDNASIFSAEARALQMALNAIRINNRNKFVIFTDSRSVLESLEHKRVDNPMILDLLETYQELVDNGKEIVFCWVPSHVDIKGNEKADRAAKEALELIPSDILLPHTDLKTLVNCHNNLLWQEAWNDANGNKLQMVQPFVGKKMITYSPSRRDDMVMHRARIGHTHITHCYLLKGEPPPECIACQSRLTVKHILLDCVDFQPTRDQYYSVRTLKELFDKVDSEKIINYLKAIDLHNKF